MIVAGIREPLDTFPSKSNSKRRTTDCSSIRIEAELACNGRDGIRSKLATDPFPNCYCRSTFRTGDKITSIFIPVVHISSHLPREE